MRKNILRIAIPSIFSNITVPLSGLVSIAIAGHLGDTSYLAAMGLGTTIFSTIYWLFNFLRMSTGGFTAQAYGAGDDERGQKILQQMLVLSFILAGGILLFRSLVFDVSLLRFTLESSVVQQTRSYFDILIWGAPAVLALYVLNGWLLGMQRAELLLGITLVQNLLGVAVSWVLVFGLGWKIEGIAMGTLISQWVGVGFAAVWVWRIVRRQRNVDKCSSKPMVDAMSWRKFFTVNICIFLRTLCLVIVTFSFTLFGAREGMVSWGVNTLLLKYFVLVSYVMDGFAYAGEAIGGRLSGENNLADFRRLVKYLFLFGGILSLGFLFVFWGFGSSLIELLTNVEEVRELAEEYLPYLVVLPVVAFSAFLLDGLLIGLISTFAMFLGMFAASLGFFFVYYFGHADWGNHALWIAFLVYLLLRAVVEGAMLPRVVHKMFRREH